MPRHLTVRLSLPNSPARSMIMICRLGFNPSDTTRDIAVLVGIYYGLCMMALAFFVIRLPRTESLPRQAAKKLHQMTAALVSRAP